MGVSCAAKGDSEPCAVAQWSSRPFESACAHCGDLAQELDELTKDYESCERENADLIDEVRSMRSRILDLEDELATTRAGHPR